LHVLWEGYSARRALRNGAQIGAGEVKRTL